MNDISALQKFRQTLYDLMPKRSDATMDLIDALSTDHRADSVTQLSLSPFFRRKYASITKVIKHFLYRDFDFDQNGKLQLVLAPCEKAHKKLTQLFISVCDIPQSRNFFLFGVDTTPCLRPHAKTLEDRGIVHSPSNTPGNKPIGVGHSFSVLAQLPEKQGTSPWIIPLNIQRVSTQEKSHEVGLHQIKEQLSDSSTPFYKKLSVLVADSLYDTLSNWKKVSQLESLILISRMKSNRNTYFQPLVKQTRKKYGEKMKLNNVNTHRPPDEMCSFYRDMASGKTRYIKASIWNNQLLRGDKHFKGHEHPITLIQFTVFDAKTQKPLFKRPLWLSIRGEKKDEISIESAYDSYSQRFDLEHFFRFGKGRLLMDKFQTPEIKHEINWWKFVQIAYVQLFLSRRLAKNMPYPWERYLPDYKDEQNNGEVSPSQTQRSFSSILKQVSTPAKPVQFRPAGNGRLLGETQPKREVHKIIIKKVAKKVAQKQPETPTTSTSNIASNVAQKVSNNTVNKQFLGLDKWLKNVKTPNLESTLGVVRELLQQLDINEIEFAQELANPAPI